MAFFFLPSSGMQNPLLAEQEALLNIRRQIAQAFAGSIVEVSAPTMRADYTFVEAQITLKDGSCTSKCRGMTLSVGTALQRVVNAEIVALVMCANELGLSITFEGAAKSISAPKEIEINTLEVFDADAVRQCETIPDVFAAMKRLGLDTEPLEVLQKSLNREGKRLNKNLIIKELFGGKRKALVGSEKEKPVKKEEKQPKPATERAVMPKAIQAIRSTEEANKVVMTLSEKGIGSAEIKAHTSFSDIYSFAMSAKESEIQNLIEQCQS